jgi:hypothetical protein
VPEAHGCGFLTMSYCTGLNFHCSLLNKNNTIAYRQQIGAINDAFALGAFEKLTGKSCKELWGQQ